MDRQQVGQGGQGRQRLYGKALALKMIDQGSVQLVGWEICLQVQRIVLRGEVACKDGQVGEGGHGS